MHLLVKRHVFVWLLPKNLSSAALHFCNRLLFTYVQLVEFVLGFVNIQVFGNCFVMPLLEVYNVIIRIYINKEIILYVSLCFAVVYMMQILNLYQCSTNM